MRKRKNSRLWKNEEGQKPINLQDLNYSRIKMRDQDGIRKNTKMIREWARKPTEIFTTKVKNWLENRRGGQGNL